MGVQVPDQQPPQQGGPSRGLLIVSAVALSIAIAGVAFGIGRLTAPTDETDAAPKLITTTTAAIVIETVGEPLDWSESGDFGERWPVTLVEHEGMVYFFGSPGLPFGPTTPEGSGLDAWASENGSDWESLGSVISAPALVRNVVSTPQGLIAIGTGAGGAPFVWRSPDARQWSASQLPDDGASQPGTQTDLSAAGANDEVVVVFGNSWFDPDQVILDAVGEDFPSYGMSYGGPSGPFTLYGPLGIPVFTATADELGLTDDQLSLLFGDQGQEGSTVWRSTDGASWITSEFDGGHVMSVTTNEDGELVALGYGMFGMEAWTSTDGVVWTSQSAVGEVDSLTPWNDGLGASRYLGRSAQLVYSDNGEDWETLGTEELLPDELSWSYYPLAAGEAGIAAVGHGYDESMDFDFAGPEPIVLEESGYTLTIDQERGSLIVADGNTEVLRLLMHSEQVHDEIVVDFPARTMTFLDPESGEALMTFTFDELEEAEQASFEGMEEGMDQQVFLFSPDGSAWSVQDVADFTGNEGSIDAMLVADDRVVAIVAEHSAIFPGPPSLPYVRIWTGLVP